MQAQADIQVEDIQTGILLDISEMCIHTDIVCSLTNEKIDGVRSIRDMEFSVSSIVYEVV